MDLSVLPNNNHPDKFLQLDVKSLMKSPPFQQASLARLQGGNYPAAQHWQNLVYSQREKKNIAAQRTKGSSGESSAVADGPLPSMSSVMKNNPLYGDISLEEAMEERKKNPSWTIEEYDRHSLHTNLSGHLKQTPNAGPGQPPPPVPVVALPGVDDSYPPQKKSFMMIKYMHDHYLDKYEWFMRADDDVYIKGDKLEEFLRSLNSSEPLYLGQTGLGNIEELGKLGLEPGENFCMGGPGMIFSREVLRRMVPHIGECLREMYTAHEDVEVGRCVRRFGGTQCVWSYEVLLVCISLDPQQPGSKPAACRHLDSLNSATPNGTSDSHDVREHNREAESMRERKSGITHLSSRVRLRMDLR
ncbi:Chondroitin sulfate synthase 3 [Fukomys damarensis]|uniref:Chondroitin sulfate synthase 3 n=1 Tax=Fukomys damarensis TaxID=885580 RepID=A0A091E9X3_FUKDA|nr:Chondroitin sulfate synthase 3 [Fukomys damarensis]